MKPNLTAMRAGKASIRAKDTTDGQFHLAIRRSDGTYKRLTGYPMSHSECCVMKTKFSNEEQSRIIFQPESTSKTRQQLIADARAAVDAINADQSVSREQTRDDLADVSNHIDDIMRGIDAEQSPRMNAAGDQW